MILKANSLIQPIYLTPSTITIDSITFTNETTKEVLTYAVSNVVEQNYYYIIYLVLALVENESYLMKAFSDGNEVFKTIVFCTNQNPAEFSINNNRYTQRASNNQYKVYE